MTSIFLIGPMGAGKSSVGRSLANKLGYDFYDSDREIEARCGVDIPTIFDYEGEIGFRDREAAIIDELTALPDIVLATGGGAILRDANKLCLRDRGHVVLLSVELKEQFRRIGLDTKRPLLHTEDPKARLRSIMACYRFASNASCRHAHITPFKIQRTRTPMSTLMSTSKKHS